jgi:hypothetical protein
MLEHLIVSGSSYSSDGIGGCPPTFENEGGCSFTNGGLAKPGSWPSFLAQKLNVKSLVNTATAGHGNTLIANSILDILNRFPYNLEKTLVVFNITHPAKLDIPCEYTHYEASHHIPWSPEIIPYSYYDRNTKLMNNIRKHMGIEQIEQATSNTLDFLFSLLKYRKINFYFLLDGVLGENYFQNRYIAPVIDRHKDRLIGLGSDATMLTYCQINNCVGTDLTHPTIQGYQLIADQIYQFISEAVC